MAKYETCRKVVFSNNDLPDVVEEVVSRLMQLPEKMIQEFIDNDWHIFITNGSIEKHIGQRECDGGFIGGITLPEFRTIFIPVSPINGDITFNAAFATIHEFGHYFDRSKGEISASYKFQNIYNQEDKVFCDYVGTAGNTTSPVEYFAEAFARFVENPDKVKEYCPITYEYFTNIFKEYEQ